MKVQPRLEDMPVGSVIFMLDGTPDGARFSTYLKKSGTHWYTVRVLGGHLEPQENLIGAFEVAYVPDPTA